MKPLILDDFSLIASQVALFTPERQHVPTGRLISLLTTVNEGLFGGEPTILPSWKELPDTVPRVVLASSDGSWKAEYSPAKLSIYWSPTETDHGQTIPDVLGKMGRVGWQLVSCYSDRVGRVGSVVLRVAEHDQPGKYLASHFCRERWADAPFNRPENFELHAHKQYEMSEAGILVNSWVRNRVGVFGDGDDAKSVVLVEQDLNTPASGSGACLEEPSLTAFLGEAAREFDAIMQLYYPKE